MIASLFARFLSLVGLFLVLASCGPVPQAGGGIGGTGSVQTVSSGPVTKFGSVFVSGTEYDTSQTVYCFDGEPCGPDNKLKLGMVVLVSGRTIESYSATPSLKRIAETITYEEAVEGTVQSIAPDGLSLVMLGQVIHLDQNTIIDSTIPEQSITHLALDQDRIEVSGFVVGDGHILATLVMMQDGPAHYEVQGIVKNHDAEARTFDIGSLRINYSGIDLSRVPSIGSSSWNGVVVHVRGEQWNRGGAAPTGGTLTATHIAAIGLGTDDSEEAKIEGVIRQVNAPGDVVVNNLRIQTTSTTVFEKGIFDDLTVDAHIIVRGRLSGGILLASHISFEGKFEAESNVYGIDGTARSLTLDGLPGITILVNDQTEIEGEGNLRTFQDIRVGDHLKIHGRPSGNGIVAIKLKRSNTSNNVKLEGLVNSVSAPTLVLAGTTIDTSDIPDHRFLHSDGTVIGRMSFFNQLTASRPVSLKGTLTANAVVWTSARLKTSHEER